MLKNSLLLILAIAFLLCVVSTSAVAVQKVEAVSSCQACISVTTQMEKIVQEGKGFTEAQIVTALEDFCSSLPSQDQQQCQSIVADVKNQILDGLFSLEDPTQYCTDLQLCPDVIIDGCTICELFATQSEKAIAAGKGVTEDQILAWLNNVCAQLPQNQQGKCRTYSARVKSQVLDGLYSQEDVTMYCTGLGACKNSAYVLPQPRVRELIVPEPEAPASDECDACKIVASVAEVLIKRDDLNETEVLKALENVCSALGTLEKECKAVVLLVGRKLLKGLFNGETPLQVCEGVSLCSSNSTSSAVETAIVTPAQRKLSLNEWNNVINRKTRRMGLKRKAEKVERN